MYYAIVDIETTGGSPKTSKITEIAIYKHDGEKVIDEFVTLVNPEMNIPEFIVRLTGIKDSMVRDAPKFYEIAKQIIEFTEGCTFVAHNVGFDYGIIRQEFKNLGYDYRREHLCTVRASRYVIPGHSSYSLGKLTRELGIEINGRHRAGGDALATAELFGLLVKKDPSGLAAFIQKEVNPKVLHPNLNIESLEEIPAKTGVYKFFNEFNQLIYVGKSKTIKNRVEQHLRNSKTSKGAKMMKEIARIEYELTGSELISLLLESQLIKHHRPIFNQQLKKNKFPYGLFDLEDDQGYLNFAIALTSKTSSIPLLSYSSKNDAISHLTKLCDDYSLCQKLCGLYPTKSACFHYSIKKCEGACIEEEETTAYNAKAETLINALTLNGDSFYIIEKGREKSEKSLILIERGILIGFGYAPYHFNGHQLPKWKRFIQQVPEDRDAKTILGSYLRANPTIEIIRF